jgi:hypothetical protein
MLFCTESIVSRLGFSDGCVAPKPTFADGPQIG